MHVKAGGNTIHPKLMLKFYASSLAGATSERATQLVSELATQLENLFSPKEQNLHTRKQRTDLMTTTARKKSLDR